jgi:hypothetical protein
MGLYLNIFCIPCGAVFFGRESREGSPLPLVILNLQISRIRLTHGLHWKTHAGCRHMPDLQVHQPELLEMSIVALSGRWPKGALTASAQMPDDTVANIVINLPHGFPWIAVGKISRPSKQVLVYLPDQSGYRLMTCLLVYPLTQLLSFSAQCFARGRNIQVSKVATVQVVVIPEARRARASAACVAVAGTNAGRCSHFVGIPHPPSCVPLLHGGVTPLLCSYGRSDSCPSD